LKYSSQEIVTVVVGASAIENAFSVVAGGGYA
jgi:hypothetical protein